MKCNETPHVYKHLCILGQIEQLSKALEFGGLLKKTEKPAKELIFAVVSFTYRKSVKATH